MNDENCPLEENTARLIIAGFGPEARPGPQAAPRRRGGTRRGLGIFLVLLLLAAGGAAAVIATSNSDRAVHLRRVVYDDVQQGIDAMKQLVEDNTK